MIIVHHLENSRSQRILWLLEELGAEYDIKTYKRDEKTSLAPPELKTVHPLGKSPVIEDDGLVIAETGAIVEYLTAKHAGLLSPPETTNDYHQYKYWIHAAEGSYAPTLIIALLLRRMETAPMPFFAKPIARKLTDAVRSAYLADTMNTLFGYAEDRLKAAQWLAGDAFTAADIMMSYPFDAFVARADSAAYPKIKEFLKRIKARAAYERALARGGPFAILP